MPDTAANATAGVEFDAPGPGLAAILLVALGEQDAEQVLQYIEPEEVQSIGEAINSMPPISQTAIAGTLEKFATDVQDQSSLGVGGGPFFQQLLVRALGREKAGSVLSRLDQHNKPVGVESLKWMPAKAIAKIVATEHPQVIAAVLSCLQRSHAGEVLQLLPADIQAEVVLRVVELDSLHPEALKELDEIITHSFKQDPGNLVTDVGGMMVGAEILNVVPSSIEEKVLEEIEQLKPGMAEKIKEKMFVFDGLLAADDRGMQGMLREVTNDVLLIALKGASEEMQEKIFKNMSKNAATMLKDDLEISGPVKLAEVEDAQREILTVATKMVEDGRLVLAGAGDDYV